MAGRKHKPEEIIGKLHEAEIVLAQGRTVLDACRRFRSALRTMPSQPWRAGKWRPSQAEKMTNIGWSRMTKCLTSVLGEAPQS